MGFWRFLVLVLYSSVSVVKYAAFGFVSGFDMFLSQDASSRVMPEYAYDMYEVLYRCLRH